MASTHKDMHKYTWEGTTFDQRSFIDYFIIKQKSHMRIQNCRVKRKSNCSSDHYMLELKVLWSFKINTDERNVKRQKAKT